jgi:hypothetical protein
MQRHQKRGRGYFVEQSTKPQTLAHSLTDSPIGLLAWIYEKLHDWTDAYPWTEDEVLTWISIYWFSRAGPAASTRIYYEASQGPGDMPMLNEPEKTTIPLGLSYFPAEIASLPQRFVIPIAFSLQDIESDLQYSWVSKIGNVVFSNYHAKGGHFAAYEQPEALVGDLKKMFGKGSTTYGVVGNHNGYKL